MSQTEIRCSPARSCDSVVTAGTCNVLMFQQLRITLGRQRSLIPCVPVSQPLADLPAILRLLCCAELQGPPEAAPVRHPWCAWPQQHPQLWRQRCCQLTAQWTWRQAQQHVELPAGCNWQVRGPYLMWRCLDGNCQRVDGWFDVLGVSMSDVLLWIATAGYLGAWH
jgi:hypothetical protein